MLSPMKLPSEPRPTEVARAALKRIAVAMASGNTSGAPGLCGRSKLTAPMGGRGLVHGLIQAKDMTKKACPRGEARAAKGWVDVGVTGAIKGAAPSLAEKALAG